MGSGLRLVEKRRFTWMRLQRKVRRSTVTYFRNCRARNKTVLLRYLSSGCHNKIAQTRWYKQHSFSQFWKLGSPRSSCQQSQYLVRILLLACRLLPPHCVLMWPFLGGCSWRERARLPRPLLSRALIPSQGPSL